LCGAAVLRLTNRVDGEIESPPLLFEQRSLRRQHPPEFAGLGSQQPFDVAQRHADELQRHDLLEHGHVVSDVDSIPRGGASRFEQPETVVVVERPDTDARQLGELVDSIGPLTIRIHRVRIQR